MISLTERGGYMSFTAIDFHTLLDTDIWVIEQALDIPLPAIPTMSSTYDDQTGMTNIFISVGDDPITEAKREAVLSYQSRLAPALFVLAQKIYAEIFHFLLVQNGSRVNNGYKQSNIETQVRALLRGAASPFNPIPFSSISEANDWFSGRYDFESLRNARNQIMHNQYSFSSGTLTTLHNGASVLNWDATNIINYTTEVLNKAKLIR